MSTKKNRIKRRPLFHEGRGNREDDLAVDRVAGNGASQIDSDPAGNHEPPAHDGLADRGIHLTQVESDDAPENDVEQDDEDEDELVSLRVGRGHGGQEAGPGHPCPSLNIGVGCHAEFDHEELGENAERGAEHEEGGEEQEDVTTGDVIIFEFNNGRRVLNDTATDEPGRENGKAFYFYPTEKYCGETETGYCKSSESRRSGGCKAMFMCHKKSSFYVVQKTK